MGTVRILSRGDFPATQLQSPVDGTLIYRLIFHYYTVHPLFVDLLLLFTSLHYPHFVLIKLRWQRRQLKYVSVNALLAHLAFLGNHFEVYYVCMYMFSIICHQEVYFDTVMVRLRVSGSGIGSVTGFGRVLLIVSNTNAIGKLT